MDKSYKNGHVTKIAMVKALEETLGVLTPALKQVGVSRSQHYKWMSNDSSYADAVSEINELAKDFVETKLHKQIQEGDVSAISFYLKTKGQDRGYTDKVISKDDEQEHDIEHEDQKSEQK
jgi:hypothetical protein